PGTSSGRSPSRSKARTGQGVWSILKRTALKRSFSSTSSTIWTASCSSTGSPASKQTSSGGSATFKVIAQAGAGKGVGRKARRFPDRNPVKGVDLFRMRPDLPGRTPSQINKAEHVAPGPPECLGIDPQKPYELYADPQLFPYFARRALAGMLAIADKPS